MKRQRNYATTMTIKASNSNTNMARAIAFQFDLVSQGHAVGVVGEVEQGGAVEGEFAMTTWIFLGVFLEVDHTEDEDEDAAADVGCDQRVRDGLCLLIKRGAKPIFSGAEIHSSDVCE